MGMRGAEEQVVDDLLERLATAENGAAAMLRFGEVAEQSGLESFIYGYSPSAYTVDGSWTVPAIRTHNVSADWDANVRAVRWADPYYHACFGHRLAVDWHDVQHDHRLSPEQRSFLKGVAEHDMTQGITIPLRLQEGAISFLSFLGSDRNREFAQTLRAQRPLLFLMAYTFLNVMQTRFLKEMTRPGSSLLGKREMECLRWSALGKSVSDTGIILGISPETVRIHLKRAYAKLEASNRANAIAKAMQFGLLDLAS